MTENTKGTIYTDEDKIGRVQISEDVVAVIAGIAATEAEGVASLVGNITNEIVSKMGIKNLSRGIKIQMAESTVSVVVTINIIYGYNVPEVCQNVQEKVSSAIETMTGLQVAQVDVDVTDITVNNK